MNYYLAEVKDPQRESQTPYMAECEDIIQALQMDFNEGNEFKAIWRTAAARLGNGKPGQKALYDAEKRAHYAQRSVRQLRFEQQQAAKEKDVEIKTIIGGKETLLTVPASSVQQAIPFKAGQDLPSHWFTHYPGVGVPKEAGTFTPVFVQFHDGEVADRSYLPCDIAWDEVKRWRFAQ